MAKRRGQIQIAVDKIDAQIEDLQRVKQLLLDTLQAQPKRERKPKAAKPSAVVREERVG